MKATVGFLLAFAATGAFAQANSIAFAIIPTLDDLGLVGLVVMIGALGGWIVRRRK